MSYHLPHERSPLVAKQRASRYNVLRGDSNMSEECHYVSAKRRPPHDSRSWNSSPVFVCRFPSLFAAISAAARLRGNPTKPAIVCLPQPGVGADSGSFQLP